MTRKTSKTSTVSKKKAKSAPRKKKTTAGKAPAKKTVAKKAPTKKSTSKKPTSKKPTSKKPTTKKTSAKKAPVKTVPVKKSPAKKTPASKKTSTKKKVAGATTPQKKPAAAAKKTKKKAAPRRKSKKIGTRSGASSLAAAAAAATADAKGYVFINGRRVRMISTKNIAESKKEKPRVAVAAVPEVVEIEMKKKPVKTKLKKKELDHFRNLLLLKRTEIVGDLTALETEALRSRDGDLSHMPIHMADVGSDTYEQDFMLGLAESERQRLREIDGALQRIQNRTYGMCLHTGEPIPIARLEAKPWAQYTIESARLVESGQVTR